LYQRRRRRQRRRYWVRPWIHNRPLFRDYENLMVEIEVETHGDFLNYSGWSQQYFTSDQMAPG